MSDKEDSRSVSRSRSRSKDRYSKHSSSRSRTRSRSKKRYSRSRTPERKDSRSRSRSHYRRYSRSRSRSRSYDRRRSSRYDRDRDSGRRYDDYDRRDYRGRSRSKSPMSHRRRHQGDRENPTTSRCVGVFGLSLRTDEREVRDVFERYGPIEEIQIVYDHQTGKSRGFGFIYYRDLDDAVEAKETAAGTEIDGRKIRVDYSITKRAHTPTPGVYLGRPSDSGYQARRSRSPPPRKSSRRRSRSYSRDRSYSPRRY